MNSIQKIESAVYAIRPELITEDTTYEPITLSDILLTIGGTVSIDGIGFIYRMTSTGIWINVRREDGLCLQYNLRLSPYDQSTEVKDFIAENLTK